MIYRNPIIQQNDILQPEYCTSKYNLHYFLLIALINLGFLIFIIF